MTANAGKDADRHSEESSTGSGGKKSKWKRTSAANKRPGDEVTLRTDGGPDGSDPDGADPDGADLDGADLDRAEDSVVGNAGRKPAGRETDSFRPGAEDTVRDLELPRVSPSGDAAGSADRLVARGSARGAGSDRSTERHDGSPFRSEALQLTEAGAGGAAGAAGSGSASDGAPPYGRAASGAIEPAARPGGVATSGGRKPPRKAHLQVARFEPWSVMKFSFITSLVCFVVLFVAVTVLYLILSALGVFDALSSTIRDLQVKGSNGGGGFNPASWFSAARVLGYTALIGTLNVLLITALATVWSVIYNLAADLVGGVEVTLTEADQ